MNTNNIKSFAKEARLLLLEGVFQRLKYWGFQEDGTNKENLQTTQGGFIFRTNPYTDVSVPPKWHKLKAKLKNKQDVKDVVEEASYTWFNRLMAIKILEANGYIPKQLGYTEGSRTPLIVQNAKRGEHNITKPAEKELLIEFLKEDKDEEAFALLITNLCHTNTLLHDIFGRIDDYTEILFPQNVLKIDGLLDLMNSDAIIAEDFKEVELIGWLYQFYISDKKDEVFKGFKKNIKARAEDIPAATQIFTPKWIVKYMVENTVGKIYLDYEPDSDLRDQMKYLVQNDSDTAVSSSVVENKALITDLTQLTLIDPAAGSGHILVTGFELLFKMYREAGYNAEKAVKNILQHNLYGLDIDDRAMQLARFAVLLKAAQYDAEILEDPIMPHIYSFPEDTLGNFFTQTYYSRSQSNWPDLLGMQLAEPISIEWEETKKNKTKTHKVTFKKGDVLNEAMVDLLQLHCDEAIATDYSQELELFWGDYEKPYNYSEFFYAIKLLRQGKNLGSAIKLNISSEVYIHINEQYHNWILKENVAELNIEETSIFNLLKPFLDVFLVLANQYKAVVANPPYMGQKSMNDDLRLYLFSNYPLTHGDLATVFMDVSFSLLAKDGVYSMINQASWMLKPSFKILREDLINKSDNILSIETLLYLGPGVFEELKGEVVQSVCFSIASRKAQLPKLYKLNRFKTSHDKEVAFLSGDVIPYEKSIRDFDAFSGKQFGFWLKKELLEDFDLNPIRKYGDAKQGIKTGENKRFIKNWHEVSNLKMHQKWFPVEKGGEYRKWYGNNNFILNWEKDGYEIKNFKNEKGKLRSRPQNLSFFFTEGITWSTSAGEKPSFRLSSDIFGFESSGSKFFVNGPVYSLEHFLGFFNSKVTKYIIEVFAPGIGFSEGSIKALPFLQIPNINLGIIKSKGINSIKISKTDWDSRESSWDFMQSPLVNEGNTLKQAYQNWQNSATQDFFQLHANEEELNRIFIDIYGLQDELTPEVKLKDITILQEELNGKDLEALESAFRDKGKDAISLPINKTEVISQFISYAIGIFLGRYRLDKPGLNIAHPNPTEQELSSYQYNGQNITIDDDGIVPLMGEDSAFPDDALVRTKDLLLTIWGENALTENINFLRDALGMDLQKWLTEKFWGYHTSMYKKRPIYWLFSSNVKKPQNAAFKVLVYMHRMDKYTVQQIQRKYLYPHQEYIKSEKDKLAQEEDSLNKEQQKDLELLRDWEIECRDYNEVLKTLANQQIEIDLDDGVTVNYAKFEGAVAII
jgi:hypothetical protein